MRQACEALAQNEIIGLEIAEFEATWPQSDAPASPDGLIDALQPLLNTMDRAKV